MPIPVPKGRVLAARGRRIGAQASLNVRFEWFIKEVSDKIAMTLRQRTEIAAQFLKDKVVRNISTPVVKGTGPRGGRVVTGRSVSGEYPHAETTQLLTTIFHDVREVTPGNFKGYVGTPLDYGLILETRMNRSFLQRTLNEELGNLRLILTGPIVA